MFDYCHYVPILKGKQGEYHALGVLSHEDKLRMTPFIDVPFVPWDHINQRPAKSYEKHVGKVATLIERAWGTHRPLFLDLFYVKGGETTADGRHPLSYVLDDARARGLKIIPVTGLDRPVDYRNAVRNALSVDQRGLCLRLSREDIGKLTELHGTLTNMLGEMGVTPDCVDLIFDFRDTTIGEANRRIEEFRRAIRALPNIRRWRTITVAASGFPLDLSGMRPATVERFPRTELLLWETIVTQRDMPRIPSYGDYGIQHPDLLEIDPRTMRMSANLRYTLEREWMVLKARDVKRHGYPQFNELCRKLIQMAEYRGATFSWGDSYISRCAAYEEGPGSATTWRKVGTNHHLALVGRFISSLGGT